MKRRTAAVAAHLAVYAFLSFADAASAQAPFYRDKALTIVHGRAAGGSGDLRVRAVAPFLKKYLPGNPAIVHDFMDGGGGRKAANYIFNNAKPDGLTIGNVGGGVVASAVLGESGIDAVVSSDDLLARNKEWLDKKLVDLHVIVAIPRETKHPQFSYLPEIDGFIKNERERKLLAMFRTFRLAGSPFILPPGTPPERIAMVKDALVKTFKDREFYKEYNKVVGEDPTPLMPEANEKAIRELPRDPEIVELFKKFAGPGPLPAR